ncbi:MAG: 16S rRNA (guanine(966)-N(2))-methyltransferase RsmD [Desulfuromonadales bacterium]|nr:16S rRNA (guanine(966)-N(2))-methyltransferase RsmD [Desulfuromonadales bacterium]MBN2793728.1 16S rRNA (guanine(966)-N(2))-methyltransferase RsmD [Desulfuromonadales bacterium]
MRIISGTARGTQLTSLQGLTVRPTPDRVREALFSILTSRFGSFSRLKILDLFAGSGAQALEALSRGAESAVLIDSGRTAVIAIQENIRRCKFESRATFIASDVYKALPSLTKFGSFDLILMDPPYRQNHLLQVIEKIESLKLLAKDGIICAESARDEDVVEPVALTQIDHRVYGSTQITLYGHPEE